MMVQKLLKKIKIYNFLRNVNNLCNNSKKLSVSKHLINKKKGLIK